MIIHAKLLKVEVLTKFKLVIRDFILLNFVIDGASVEAAAVETVSTQFAFRQANGLDERL